ncbi:hypothetical protein [Streptomyces sp. CA-106110]|jgi:hypothetical protein|uniref:hypothetical protein n=1 Tax=Streptomyces sp. CA-106110 TaxID=3240044 RepID=UPI003D93FD60
MPVPSRRLKDDVDGTVDHHAAQQGRWPALAEVDIRWRGSFSYLTAIIQRGGQDERIPLCRIEYLGKDEEWGFALYSPATDSYTPALLHTGTDTGHPNDAFDTAALIHLAGYEA